MRVQLKTLACLAGLGLALAPAMSRAAPVLPAATFTCSVGFGPEAEEGVGCSGTANSAGAEYTYGPDTNGISGHGVVTISGGSDPSIYAYATLSTSQDFGHGGAGGSLTYYFLFDDPDHAASIVQTGIQGSVLQRLSNVGNLTGDSSVTISDADGNLIFSADPSGGVREYTSAGDVFYTGGTSPTGSYSAQFPFQPNVVYQVVMNASVVVAGGSASGEASVDPMFTILDPTDAGITLLFSPNLTATPLPAALPMMLGGLSVFGLAARRRRRQYAGAL